MWLFTLYQRVHLASSLHNSWNNYLHSEIRMKKANITVSSIHYFLLSEHCITKPEVMFKLEQEAEPWMGEEPPSQRPTGQSVHTGQGDQQEGSWADSGCVQMLNINVSTSSRPQDACSTCIRHAGHWFNGPTFYYTEYSLRCSPNLIPRFLLLDIWFSVLFCFLFLFVFGTGKQTRDLTCAKQALTQLSKTPGPRHSLLLLLYSHYIFSSIIGSFCWCQTVTEKCISTSAQSPPAPEIKPSITCI